MFIDFETSARFDTRDNVRCRGTMASDRSAPELLRADPYDPFKYDVYVIGHVILANCLNVSRTGRSESRD